MALKDSPPLSFDYRGLDNRVVTSLRTHAQDLSRLAQNTARNLWEMGRILSEAQAALASANGTFTRWVAEEAGLSVGTAYRLMNVHRAFTVSKLENAAFAPSALYLLAESSTPAAARQEALRRAEGGQAISHAQAQKIVRQYTPPKPPLPSLPEKPPLPEYRDFEREELLPQLHDAGMEDAPQVLSGQSEDRHAVPEERKRQARSNLHQAIFDVIKCVHVDDDEAIGECANEIIGLLGRNNNISIAARVGRELAHGPRTLSDLVEAAAWVCDIHLSKEDRDGYLRLRKRVLRIIDSITYGGGLPIYEHVLENEQICYSLIEDPPSCP